MKSITIRQVASALLVTLASLVASATAYAVDVTTLFSNADFSGGTVPAGSPPFFNLGIGCPTNWTCAGNPYTGASIYAPSANQYIPTSDGLPGSVSAPTTNVATMPTPIEGSGQLFMLNAVGNYAANTAYTLTVFIGTPLTVPFCGTPTADPNCKTGPPGTGTRIAPINKEGGSGRLTFYWLGNGSGTNRNQLKAIDLPIPDAGQWVQTQVSFNPSVDLVNGGSQGIGQLIGFAIFEGGGLNNEVINVAFKATCTCP